MENKGYTVIKEKRLFGYILFAFMLTIGIFKVEADPKKGVILENRSNGFLSAVFIDTIPDDGLDIPDTVIEIYQVSSHRVAMVLNKLMQEGVLIEFDNDGYYRDFGGIERGVVNNVTRIGDKDIVDIFSSMLSQKDIQEVFPYAIKKIKN